MIFLTLIVAIRMLLLRIKAVRQGNINPAYFLLNKGAKLPDNLVKATQHYENLFEMPILFYVIVLALLALQRVDAVFILLAWGYLITRVAHAYIHTTYNHLRHRRNVFLFSCLILFAMWTTLFIKLLIR
jgi:hypothetical protein